MPDLPPGPLRELTEAVHELYQAAGQLSLHKIAQFIADNEQLRGTASHESVRAILNGRLTRWDVLEAVGAQLALLTHPPRDPEVVSAGLLRLWNRAGEVGDRQEGDDTDDLLDEIDSVLEENPEEFVRGFIQQRGGIDETEFDRLLDRFSDIVPLLRGESAEPSEAQVAQFLTLVLLVFTAGIPDHRATAQLSAVDCERMAMFAARSGSWAGRIDFRELILDLRDETRPDPGFQLRRYLDSDHQQLFDYMEGNSRRSPEVDDQFREQFGRLISAAKTWTRPVQEEGNRAEASESADKTYRRHLANRDYPAALSAWQQLSEQDPDHTAKLREETGFLWLTGRDRDILAGLWSRIAVGNTPQIEVRELVWSPLVAAASDEECATDPVAGPAASVTLPRRPDAIAKRQSATTPQDTDPLDIVARLFDVAGGASQRLEFRATPAGRPDSSCHVICYRRSRPLTVQVVAPEVMKHERALIDDGIDYLVLLSLDSEVDGGLKELVADWQRRVTYPFVVRAFGASTLRLAQTRPEVILASLPPRLRVAESWLRYLREPALLTFPGEEHGPHDSTFHAQLSRRLADDNGVPLPGGAFDHVESWLAGVGQGLVVVGEFGSGKTFFTYNLARQLSETALSHPDRARVPLRLALKDLPAAGNARELLRRRLDDLGMGIADWLSVVNSLPTVVILDGFDEMSTELSRDNLLRNTKLLRDCFHLFGASKVLLTSRIGAFGAPADKQRLFDRIGDPQIVQLRRFERAEVLASLYGLAEDQSQRKRVSQLSSLHDPIDLATRPLYYGWIREMLSYLPQENLTEETLYEIYVSRTLKRKLEYLEDENLRVRPAGIVENLLAILGRVACELHRTNAPYLHLKDLDLRGLVEDGARLGLAQVLWRTREGGEPAGDSGTDEDATARVGIRSLLKGHRDGDPQRWPVDFSHRSMREYFVARSIVNAITGEAQAPPALMRQARLSPEILRFAELMLRARPSDLSWQRLEKWARSVSVDDEPSPLGANAISLLYACRHEIPGVDWDGLRLDHAQLAGANLEGLNLCHSSLRHANLDNANLTGANLTNADLTGVRLEETASVTAVAVGTGETVYAAYGDRSLRAWEVTTAQVVDRTLCTLPHSVDRLWLTPGQRIVAVGDSYLTLLGEVDGAWQPVTHFPVKSRCRLPDFVDPMVLLVDEEASGTARLLWFDPTSDAGFTVALPEVTGWWSLGQRGYVAVSPTGIVVQVDNSTLDLAQKVVSAVAVTVGPQGEVLAAVGHQDGMVRLVRLTATGRHTELWSRRLHTGPVTAVAFLGTDRVITGGVDRSLCVAPLVPSNEDDVARFQLTLRCKDVRVDGMRGDRERNLLRRLASRQ